MTSEPTAPATTEAARRLPDSTAAEIDAALATLKAASARWLAVGPAARVALLGRLRQSFAAVADRWVDACLEGEGIPPANPFAGEEWISGPYLVLRNLRLLEESLAAIAAGKRPAVPGGVWEGPGGRAVAGVFPSSAYDRLFYPGVSAEVWMEPGCGVEDVAASQATAYFGDKLEGGVALVLGAGNVSSIGPMDALYKLFVENQVVLFKAHPVNDYLGPLLAEGLAPLVEAGFLRVVYGGAAVGELLTQHPAVDEIHITGSDKTVEAIAFGTGEEGARRKAERRPRLSKRLTSELGNVSPVIVVPGPWSAADLRFQAENLVSMLANNAGFNCNATRMVLTHAAWEGRGRLLDEVRELLKTLPTRRAFYPGATERWQRFVAAYPQTECYGESSFGRLPWTFIAGVDAEHGDPLCFRTEAFTSVFAESALPGSDPAAFLTHAVEVANETLWGTLNATILVHPSSLAAPGMAEAFDRALLDLRYGTIAINHWAAVGYGLVLTTWGAFPGADLYDIQSGTGVVHNTLMFSRAEKSIVRAPFRPWPKPPWFVSHRTAHKLARRLSDFEKAPSPLKLPGIFSLALGG